MSYDTFFCFTLAPVESKLGWGKAMGKSISLRYGIKKEFLFDNVLTVDAHWILF